MSSDTSTQWHIASTWESLIFSPLSLLVGQYIFTQSVSHMLPFFSVFTIETLISQFSSVQSLSRVGLFVTP